MNTNSKKIKMRGKTASHTKMVVRSQVLELIRAEQLKTTPHKAKILKQQFDILVKQAKNDDIGSKRLVESFLQSEIAVNKLYTKILPRLKEVTSGYTLSARTLPRKGDNADQMIVQLRGAELKEKKSRLATALERREKKEEKEAQKPVTTKIRERVGRAAKMADSKKKENIGDTRRISK